MEESGMAPRYLSWVLDHLVAASKVSKVSQEKLVEDSERISAQIQYLFLGGCIFRINLLQQRPQSSSEYVSFPHFPPSVKAD